ncbi:MAG TPA: hypothetical protein VNL71_18545 [Chloroflexota bacterium]|nr:hypothetical protein [Chloroflexota bacterium]
MGSKDKGSKEVRKPKSAKKKTKTAPVIPSRVRPTEEKESSD